MLKVAGIKVSPHEIEEVIRGHTEVADVAVIGVQDSTHGEVPKAFVTRKDGSELTKEDLVAYCEKRLARYKVPRNVEFIKDLPRTPGGKVSYKQLKQDSSGVKHAD